MDLLLQLALGLLIFLLLSRKWLPRVSKNKKPTDPPEPSGAWPIIGHLHLLGGDEPVARILAAMADQHGPIFMLRLGWRRTLVISSWEAAKECFTTNDKIFANRPSIAAGKHMGYDYAMFGFAPYGAYWREIRKIATLEILSNRQLESLKHIRQKEVELSMKEIYSMWVNKNQQRQEKSSVMVEMKRWFGDLTFNVACMMVVGKRCFGSEVEGGKEEEARRFRDGLTEMLRLTGVFVAGDALPFLRWMDLGGHERGMKRTLEKMDVIVGKWLEEHRGRRSGSDGVAKDFMDVLIKIMEEAHISSYDPDTIIRATSLAIILGGTDTTAVTLTWALTLLLNNPRVLKKAQDELDSHVGKDRHVDESDIKNLVYLQAIAKETLRLYPAAPLSVPHEAVEDCSIGGFHISAGTQLLTNLWKLHRDPKVWSDPLEFRPERFLSSHAEMDVRGQQFEYIPFGSGRRSCPGISFALQVLHLTLARLMHGFEMETQGDEGVDMSESPGLTMPKEKPLEVLFSPRLPSNLFE